MAQEIFFSPTLHIYNHISLVITGRKMKLLVPAKNMVVSYFKGNKIKLFIQLCHSAVIRLGLLKNVRFFVSLS